MSEKPTYEELEQRVRELEQAESVRKKAEGKLRESESRLREAQHLAHMGNWFWDVNSGEVKWSSEVFKIFRLDPKEFTPHIDSILDLSPWPEDHQRDKELMEKAVENREVGSYEQKFLRPDGSIGYYFSSFKGVYDDNGELSAMTGVVQDITKRKQTEYLLQENEERFDLAIKGADLGMWDWNVETGEAIYSNRWASMLGYELDELAPDVRTFETLLHPEDKDRVTGLINRHFEDDNFEYNVDYRLKTKSGDWRWINARGRVFDRDKDNKPLRMVGTHMDITDGITLQAKFLQAQKMESVGRLAGGVAHDYNNISSIILGYSELALEKVDQSGPIYNDLMQIYTAAKRSADITQQLLAFARQQTIAPKVLDLNDAIGNILNMLRTLIGEDIDLAWKPGTKVWPIKIDPSQVDQILTNLCVNARDAIADVGKVTIETRNISFDNDFCADHTDFFPGDYVLLSVSDDGSGMAPGTLDKIFEPFFTTKGRGKGTGLGLSTVYGIVKQNKGFINIYSEPGKGTTIKVYLSRYTGQAVEATREDIIEIPLSCGETVLLVEDDDSIRKFGEIVLESLGYTVLSATSAAKAARLAKEHADEIKLLVTDVVMPEMNGRELSEQLQLLYPNLKTVFMSGYTANVIAHRGVLEEGVFFMPKPFSKKDMAVIVRTALDSVNPD